MKRLSKILKSIGICCLSLLFVGCNKGGKDAEENEKVFSYVVNDRQVHDIEGTLHKVKVLETQNVFTSNGTTDYKIVYDSSEYYQEMAANFIINHVKKATGAKLGVLSPADAVWSNTNKYIVVGDKDLFESAGLTMPTDDIGLTGYYIKTVGKSAFIMTNGNDGYQLGAIAFLREVLGYDMLSDDCVVYEKKGDTMPNMDIVERPDYDFRQNPNKLQTDTIYGMGFTNDNDVWIPVAGYKLHNSLKWLPLDKYLTTHPKWYSDEASISDLIGEENGQLCYTAHGDTTEYAAMVNAAVESAKTAISTCSNPAARTISFTIADNPGSCNCSACREVLSKYGCISASVVHFLNDVDDKLQAWLEEEARKAGTVKKEINIVFFAYYATETPPAVRNQDGTFSPADETVICNDHVGVYIAPIQAKYNVSFYDENNKVTADNIKGWAACSNLIYLWLYQTNFNHYLYPMDNWDVISENYRFGKENNAVFMYDEGQLNQPTTTHFTRLKDYIASKTEFDLNANYDDILDKYFKYYFLDASEYMRSYFDELQAYMRYLEVAYANKLGGGIRDMMANTDFWKQGTLEGWMNKINLALQSVEKYKGVDDEKYNMLVRHIKIESVFPRFVLCSLYSGMYDDATLLQMRKSLRDDCLELGIERSAEYAMIDTTFKSWGL